MLLLEHMGVGVITYIKPLVVLGVFGVATVVLLAIPAYDIAMRVPGQGEKS
jgi:hypothetical protein